MEGDLPQTVTQGVGEVMLEKLAGEGVREVMESGRVQGAAPVEIRFRAHQGGSGALLQAGTPVRVDGSREGGGVVGGRLVEREGRFAGGRGVEIEVWTHTFL